MGVSKNEENKSLNAMSPDPLLSETFGKGSSCARLNSTYDTTDMNGITQRGWNAVLDKNTSIEATSFYLSFPSEMIVNNRWLHNSLDHFLRNDLQQSRRLNSLDHFRRIDLQHSR